MKNRKDLSSEEEEPEQIQLNKSKDDKEKKLIIYSSFIYSIFVL